MKKFTVIFFIFFLILITAFIKNSTKKIEDEIFTVQVNLKELKKDLGDIKLEFDYLSSAEKLINYQNLYFENKLTQKSINEIKIIDFTGEKIFTNNLKFIGTKK